MTGSQDVGIDHVMVGTPDLEVTHLKLQRLGFKTTPRGTHDRLGTANHTALFADNSYLEIIAVVTAGPANAAYRAAIDAVGEGVAGLALRTSSAPEFHQLASELGLGPEAVVEFDRWVGSAGRSARFSIVRLPSETLPPLSLFACQHHTPELVWLPELMSHPNGVTGMASVTFMDSGEKGAGLLSRLTRQPVRRDRDMTMITAGSTKLLFVPRSKVEIPIGDGATKSGCVCNIAFYVSDLEKAQSWFQRQDVALCSSGPRLTVPASQTFGFPLDFIEARTPAFETWPPALQRAARRPA